MTKVVLVDDNDKVVGLKEKFSAHKNPVPLHRAISILIFNKDGKKVLIQKRSEFKKTWPMYWTNTVCADVRPEETYLATAKRRLMEEMGIKTKLKYVFNFIYQFKYNKTWGEHELDHVFTGTYDGVVSANPMEASGYEWIGVSDLKRDIKKSPRKYTPWFPIVLSGLKI